MSARTTQNIKKLKPTRTARFSVRRFTHQEIPRDSTATGCEESGHRDPDRYSTQRTLKGTRGETNMLHRCHRCCWCGGVWKCYMWIGGYRRSGGQEVGSLLMISLTLSSTTHWPPLRLMRWMCVWCLSVCFVWTFLLAHDPSFAAPIASYRYPSTAAHVTLV